MGRACITYVALICILMQPTSAKYNQLATSRCLSYFMTPSLACRVWYFTYSYNIYIYGETPTPLCNSFASVPLLAPTWARTRDPLQTSTTVTLEARLPIAPQKLLQGLRASDVPD
jgi:hypothetical protein